MMHDEKKPLKFPRDEVSPHGDYEVGHQPHRFFPHPPYYHIILNVICLCTSMLLEAPKKILR